MARGPAWSSLYSSCCFTPFPHWQEGLVTHCKEKGNDKCAMGLRACQNWDVNPVYLTVKLQLLYHHPDLSFSSSKNTVMGTSSPQLCTGTEGRPVSHGAIVRGKGGHCYQISCFFVPHLTFQRSQYFCFFLGNQRLRHICDLSKGYRGANNWVRI